MCSSFDDEASNWNLTRAEVSKISITVLMSRCEYILNRFLHDENDMGMLFRLCVFHQYVIDVIGC